MERLRVGIVGVGNISGIYLTNLGKSEEVEIVAIADVNLDRAKTVAEANGIKKALTPEALYQDSDVEAVLNLTIPAAHAEVNLSAIRHKKHTYGEKPLCAELVDAQTLLSEARASNLYVGCAPDTFLGGCHQECRHLIDSGSIGQPVNVQAFMLSGGVENWHPNPEFFYKPGAGPLLDMGPYYLTAFVNLLGPIKSVVSTTATTHAERLITSEPFKGNRIVVETPTTIQILCEFVSGATGQLTVSFDIPFNRMPNITVYGTEGTLGVPDPNNFNGKIELRNRSNEAWTEVTFDRPYTENSRGVGLRAMARAIRAKEAYQGASGELAFHVLEAMHAAFESGKTGQRVMLKSRPERPKTIEQLFPAGALAH